MTEQSHRLDQGGHIDRGKPLRFEFNGKKYQGFRGDTLASALLANGVHLIGRSFKYHRPRGIVSAGVEETNALVQLLGPNEEPNVLATRLQLYDGLSARSVNCWPSVKFDMGAINSFLSPLFPAGFYYKTFMWRPWKFYAQFIRSMAGLGNSPKAYTNEHYEKRFRHCDILIVGAGPSGLLAALTAVRSGARILLVDDQPNPGGDLSNHPVTIDGKDAQDWVQDVMSELVTDQRFVYLPNTVATGYYDHNLITVVEQTPKEPWIRERLCNVRAKQVVLATGSIERSMIFPNNDRPGVMLTSAVLTYLHRYAVKPGINAVMYTNNNSTYESAVAIHELGLTVKCIVDSRNEVNPKCKALAEQAGIGVLAGQQIVDVKGSMSVSAVATAPVTKLNDQRQIVCDLVCVSGGWNPTLHLHSQSGAKPVFDTMNQCFVPGNSVQAETTTGAAAGYFTLSKCLADGIRAGKLAVDAVGFTVVNTPTVPTCCDSFELDIQTDWATSSNQAHKGKAFLDFQNDVTTGDIDLALRENFTSVEHVKRYTTAGMATDQGKIGNTNVIGYIAGNFDSSPGDVGTTTYRPPYTPISFGVIAGGANEELIIPIRRTPITDWHISAGARMNEAGANYRRPFFYPKPGESDLDAISRAAFAVRNSVGIYDGSPLGKFELYGNDVLKLLNLVYTNRWDDLSIGQGRFGLMLHEDGRLMDDGVTFRLGEKHFLMSTGTGTANVVYGHLERLLQTEFPHWQVYLTIVTNQWANICVCGPKARDVLTRACTNIDLSSSAFPFMHLCNGQVAGFDARVARVSYTGELSFEINIRARHGLSAWEALMEAGKEFDITPVGSESSTVLRIEKGFVAAGTEGDNITNPFDAGLGWVVDMNKPDFIGKRTLIRDQKHDIERQHVVGLLPLTVTTAPAEGSAIQNINPDSICDFQGHVTASCFSPNLDRPVALALLKNGRKRMGEVVSISGLEQSMRAEVTKPVFIDPISERMRS